MSHCLHLVRVTCPGCVSSHLPMHPQLLYRNGHMKIRDDLLTQADNITASPYPPHLIFSSLAGICKSDYCDVLVAPCTCPYGRASSSLKMTFQLLSCPSVSSCFSSINNLMLPLLWLLTTSFWSYSHSKNPMVIHGRIFAFIYIKCW